MAFLLFGFEFIELSVLVVAALVCICWTGYWLVHLLALVYGRLRLHRKPLDEGSRETPLPGVSIIKPLVGVDPNLLSNLETFFTLKYPKYQLLFCVHNDSDPSLMLVKTLMNRHPTIDASVFVGGQNVGHNPKINNMMPGYEAAKYDLILISDAGVRMKDDTLLDIVDAMKDDVGIVTQMPFTCDRKGFAATLEKVYFGTAHARIYLSADAVGIICSTGMSSLIRKPLLDQVGGMKAFGVYLAEDYFFAHSIAKRGWKCAVSSQPAWQNSGTCTVNAFHERIARWTKVRVAMLPLTMILEPLQECVVFGLLASLAVNILLGWNSLVFFIGHLLVWMIFDYCLLRIVQNGALPFGKFEFVVSWLYREMTTVPYFFLAMYDQRIAWRTGTYRLRWGGRAERIPSGQTLASLSTSNGHKNGCHNGNNNNGSCANGNSAMNGVKLAKV